MSFPRPSPSLSISISLYFHLSVFLPIFISTFLSFSTLHSLFSFHVYEYISPFSTLPQLIYHRKDWSLLRPLTRMVSVYVSCILGWRTQFMYVHYGDLSLCVRGASYPYIFWLCFNRLMRICVSCGPRLWLASLMKQSWSAPISGTYASTVYINVCVCFCMCVPHRIYIYIYDEIIFI